MKLRWVLIIFFVLLLILVSGCTEKSRLIKQCKKDCIVVGTIKRGLVPGLSEQCELGCKAAYRTGGPEGIKFIIGKYEEEIRMANLG